MEDESDLGIGAANAADERGVLEREVRGDAVTSRHRHPAPADRERDGNARRAREPERQRHALRGARVVEDETPLAFGAARLAQLGNGWLLTRDVVDAEALPRS